MNVMIERLAESRHLAIKLLFSRMRKWGMTDVVNQSQGFNQILIKAEHVRYRPGNLRNLDRVGQPVAEVVRDAGRENLRLSFQPAERAGVNDAVAIPLKRVPVWMLSFRIAPTASLRGWKTKLIEHPKQRCRYFFGISLRRRAAAPAIWLLSFTSGSKSLRASAGFLLLMLSANARIA